MSRVDATTPYVRNEAPKVCDLCDSHISKYSQMEVHHISFSGFFHVHTNCAELAVRSVLKEKKKLNENSAEFIRKQIRFLQNKLKEGGFKE